MPLKSNPSQRYRQFSGLDFQTQSFNTFERMVKEAIPGSDSILDVQVTRIEGNDPPSPPGQECIQMRIPLQYWNLELNAGLPTQMLSGFTVGMAPGTGTR